MQYYEEFRYCPRCGTAYGEGDFDPTALLFRCAACDFHFYQNSIPSAAVIIPELGREDRVMLITRGTQPGRGLLALPGGILDYGEPPEVAAVREVREETGYEVRIEDLFDIRHLDYLYQGRIRSVLEHQYLARPVPVDATAGGTPEAAAIGFYPAAAIESPAAVAFACHHDALRRYAALHPSPTMGRDEGHETGQRPADQRR